MEHAPVLLFWVLGEAFLGLLSGFGCVDAYMSHDFKQIAIIGLATLLGTGLGVSRSGAIDWSKCTWFRRFKK